MTLRTDSKRRARRLIALCAVAGSLAAAQSALAAPQATLSINSANGPLETSSSCCAFGGQGAFKVTNESSSGEQITRIVIDAANGPAVFPDIVFDPDDDTPAGDVVSFDYTQMAGSTSAGVTSSAVYASPNGGGFNVLDISAGGLGPAETLGFAIDMDPTSIQGAPGTASGGHIAAVEIHGATVSITFSNGETLSTDVIGDPVPPNGWKAKAVLRAGVKSAPILTRAGGGSSPATVTFATQSLVVSGAPGETGVIYVAEGNLSVESAPGGGFDLDPFEANKAKGFQKIAFTIGAGGTATVPVTLTRTADGLARPDSLGLNYITAYFHGPDGSARVSGPLVLLLNPAGDATPPTVAARTPAPGAAGVSRNADVSVTFSEPIDLGTAVSGITLAPAAGGSPVTAVLTGAPGATVSLAPVGALAANTQYRATVAASVADPAGNPLGTAQSWTFTTSSSGAGKDSDVPATAVCQPLPKPRAKASGKGKISLSIRQMRINQRISAAAIRRANSVESWLAGGIARRDLCGTGLLPDSFTGISFGTGGPVIAGAAPDPRSLKVAKPGAATGRFVLSAKQLRINQRISAAAVRRSNALADRMRVLTGGDVVNGAIGPGILVPGTTVLSAPNPASNPSASVTRVAPAAAANATFRVSVGQLRIEQRISAAAVTRLNALQRQIRAGLTSANFKDGALTAVDLDPGLRR